ncbi:diguanylate cyclase domain-containing protein [Thalassolituus sp. LLYu03]|uniref:diguanylate cyclase domain-containing protein n=1 Tax=Thalassolituus sp. LLYu03 TaxID=3421656 RepID=UPI003D2AA8A5
MFTIRQLYTAMSLGYVALMLTGMLTIRYLWFYPEEQRHALQIQQGEINGLMAAMNLRLEQLAAITHDYASWDDTFEYADNGNDEYIESNFTESTYKSLNLSSVAIVAADSQILYSGYFENGELTDVPEPLLAWISNSGAEFFNDTVHSGFQVIDQKAYVIASSPVSPTGLDTPVNGWLLFMQQVDEQYLHVLAEVARLNLTLIKPPYRDNIPDIQEPLSDVTARRVTCIYDETHVPSLCTEIRHSNGDGPRMFSIELMLAFLIMSLIPTAAFVVVLKILIDPLRLATGLLERSRFDHTLRPVLHTTPVRIQELQQLRNAYNELIHTVRQQQAKLEQLSNTDRLTNIPNRRAFEDALTTTWRRILRHPQSMALILVDIDYFKRFNDHYGHQAGDTALHAVAQALRLCTRRTDELTARFGGEEFAMIVQIEDALHLEKVRRNIAEAIRGLDIHHEHSKVSRQLTISFGIAWIKESGEWLETITPEGWLRAADTALYEAKASGRNCSMLHVLDPAIPLTESPVWQQSPDSP